jgi:hypothetical protein
MVQTTATPAAAGSPMQDGSCPGCCLGNFYELYTDLASSVMSPLWRRRSSVRCLMMRSMDLQHTGRAVSSRMLRGSICHTVPQRTRLRPH